MRRLLTWLHDFYWGEGIADDVPALTYYLVLSLAPFALGLAALEALLLKDVVSALQVAEQLNRFLPEALHDDIRRLVLGTRDDSPLLFADRDHGDAVDDLGRDRRDRALPGADHRWPAPQHRRRPAAQRRARRARRAGGDPRLGEHLRRLEHQLPAAAGNRIVSGR